MDMWVGCVTFNDTPDGRSANDYTYGVTTTTTSGVAGVARVTCVTGGVDRFTSVHTDYLTGVYQPNKKIYGCGAARKSRLVGRHWV
jgi:hypothetical protein